jgi:hypothetical protein
MGRQEDDCWRCGIPWVEDGGRSPSPSSRGRGAATHVANGQASVALADEPRATTQAQLAADRWADEGGSFDPNGNGVSAVPPGRRSAAASARR